MSIKKLNIRKLPLPALALCAALCVCLLGGTIMAILTANKSAVNNTSTGVNTIELVQNGSFPAMPVNGAASSGDASVYVTNNGDLPCYVRLKVVISNDNLAKKVTLSNLDSVNWNTSFIDAGGYDTGDNSSYDDGNNLYGYYYYEQPIAAGESTTTLFDGVTIAAGTDDVETLNYGISVYAESVQQGDSATWKDAWEDFIK